MPYVQRDATGRISGLFGQPDGEGQEWLELDSPELQLFLHSLMAEGSSETLSRLLETDLAMIRVVEDLVDTLISKDLMRFTDLPDAAQAKLLERRSLRRSVNALQIFDGDDQPLL